MAQLYTKGIINIYDTTYTNKRGILYNDLIVCFDIEVSSAWITPDGRQISFDKSLGKEYYQKCIPIALCYLWQCAVENQVFYGRELESFNDVLEELASKYRGIITCWVHNLSYEFQFLLNIMTFDKIFARSPHKVIYADMWRFRFRCSFFLTRLSLKNWGESLNHHDERKQENYDYLKIRTPKTPLSDKELTYGIMDVKVMVSGIREELEHYKHIADIPLTQTGKVRQHVKQMYHNDRQQHKLCTDLLPINASEYAMFKLLFAGGYTHANYIYSDRVLNDVKSKDRSSSYPALMCVKKYPCTPWEEIESNEMDDYLNSDYSEIIDITFYDIESITFNVYISSSKAYEIEDPVIDNGRVSSAKKLSLVITNVDYEIIRKSYKWNVKETKINKVLISVNDYLPLKFVKYVQELYKQKTELKGVKKMAAIYAKAKEFINALFGMMCTAILQEDVMFNLVEWTVNHLTEKEIDDGLEYLRKHPHKNFLAYQHGIWITAYARQALWDAILKIDDDNAYSDTDSTKYVGNHDDIFDQINSTLLSEIATVCDERGMTMDDFTATDSKGNVHIMGLWEDDGVYSEFITLGAKRYAYRDSKNGELHLTVSGVSKKGVTALRDDIHNFNRDIVFGPDESGRLIFTYIHNMPKWIWNAGESDEYTSNYCYGINAMPSTYSMSLADEYEDLIEVAGEIITNLDYTASDLHKIMERKKK